MEPAMHLIKPQHPHISQLMSWFTTAQELKQWSGPGFRYPFDRCSFVDDLNIDTKQSFVLVSQESRMLAFGQYYLRLGKCHLARLIVAPSSRGQGIAATLIEKLSAAGQIELGVTQTSLLVYTDNADAVASYTRQGFIETDYRATHIPAINSLEIRIEKFDNCLYMVK